MADPTRVKNFWPGPITTSDHSATENSLVEYLTAVLNLPELMLISLPIKECVKELIPDVGVQKPLLEVWEWQASGRGSEKKDLFKACLTLKWGGNLVKQGPKLPRVWLCPTWMDLFWLTSGEWNGKVVPWTYFFKVATGLLLTLSRKFTTWNCEGCWLVDWFEADELNE